MHLKSGILGDRFYNFIVFVGRFPFLVSSRPVLLHLDRMPASGAALVACTHTSPYDIGVLMRSSPRKLDFVSITEVFKNPFIAWFYSHMNAFPLDRSRRDSKTVRVILDRLAHGRVIAVFPEGRLREPAESIVHGKPFKSDVVRLARMSNAPIVPVVIWDALAYNRPASWLPLRRVRYGMIFGKPIAATEESAAQTELAAAYRSLYAELNAALHPAK